MNQEAAIIKAPATMLPRLSAFCGSPPSFTLTKKVPIIEATIPTPASTKGNRTAPRPLNFIPNSGIKKKAAPRTIVPTIEPTYDSKRSAPIPATSPTLSPTLSAIVAGFKWMIFWNTSFNFTN